MSPVEVQTPLAAGVWSVDVTTARAGFRCRDVLHRPVLGSLDVTSGVVEVAESGKPVGVRAVLDLASVETGSGRRDKDLRGRSFFDVQSSGYLTFVGGCAQRRADGGWTLPGTLTLKGERCPVELEIDVSDAGRRVRATATLDRRDLGIHVPRLLVGTAVEITVEVDLQPPA